MTKERKIALALAGTILLTGMSGSLTGCSKDKENEKRIETSETSIDAKDIVIIDTHNVYVESKGVEERYLILYKVGTEESKELSSVSTKAVSYIYRDINNSSYVGVFTEYMDRSSNEVASRLFAYSKEDMSDDRSIIVIPTLDKSWYGSLVDLIDPSLLKNAYEIEELKEMYNKLNKDYLNNNDNSIIKNYKLYI